MALVYSAIRVLLGLFYLLTGAVKITDQLSATVHLKMKLLFIRYADVFPLNNMGYKPEAEEYMQVVGWIEVVAGLLLAFGPRILQKISNYVLSIIMIGAIYTLLILKEPIAMCAPATICLGLLLLLNVRGSGRKPKSKFE